MNDDACRDGPDAQNRDACRDGFDAQNVANSPRSQRSTDALEASTAAAPAEAARELLSNSRCDRNGDANMATLTVLSRESGLDAAATNAERADAVQATLPRAVAVQPPTFDAQKTGKVYLFIYRVRHAYDAYAWVDNVRYCTVFALGKTFADAERIAINCVHQHSWRILKTDTATAFDIERFTEGGTDAAHIANLRDFGVSFKLNH